MGPIVESDRSAKADSSSQAITAGQGGWLLEYGRRLLRVLLRTNATADNLQPLSIYYTPLRKVPWLLGSFLLFVALPSIVSVAYLAAVAAPQFATEARLIVRSAQLRS